MQQDKTAMPANLSHFQQTMIIVLLCVLDNRVTLIKFESKSWLSLKLNAKKMGCGLVGKIALIENTYRVCLSCESDRPIRNSLYDMLL